ncbi:MAG: hypothetical protein HY688_04940 [Chloroflexi bacterium]|nr:hypothetical protein [Chloroflexota bacterium]
MESLCRRYRDRGVVSFLVYSREPHPGSAHPQPTTYDQRRRYAAEMRASHQMERPVLIDDPEQSNPVRIAYGALANMSFIISTRGLVIFRSNWTRPVEVEEVLQNLLVAEEARKQHIGLTVVHSERAIYRPPEEALNLERVSYPIFKDAGHLEQIYGENLEGVRRRLGITE